MIYLKWSNELDLGISEIDEQHQHLAGFINVLAISRNAGARHEQMVRIFDDLIADVLVHFAFEAEMFERSGYAHAREHKRAHSELLRKLSEYRSRFRAGEDVLDIVLDTLVTWLPNHIKHDDAKYAAFLAETQGASAQFELRPRDAKIAKKYAKTLPLLKLFTAEEVFGSLKQAQAGHFTDGGVFDRFHAKR